MVPKTRERLLFVEKWILLAIAACVVLFGLFLQCGGIFCYDMGKDCMQFNEAEKAVIYGSVYSAASCRKAQAVVIESYRRSQGKSFISKDELLGAYKHPPCRVLRNETSFSYSPTSKTGSSGGQLGGDRIVPILEELDNGMIKTVTAGWGAPAGVYEIIYLSETGLRSSSAVGRSSEVPELCPIPAAGQKTGG